MFRGFRRGSIRLLLPVSAAMVLGVACCREDGGTKPQPPASLSPAMLLIPAGSFVMGSPAGEPGRFEGEIQRQITLSLGFWISRCEVTQAEWQDVMGWMEPYQEGPRRPIENITWFDAVEYCNRLSAREGRTPAYTITATIRDGRHIMHGTVLPHPEADGYRLPTEAEWEYACRAGTTTALCNGEVAEIACGHDPNLEQLGWYCGNSSNTHHEVAGKAANAWGLHDMHGNVWEWCWDWYADYPVGPATDPVGPVSGSGHVIRGGCWSYGARYCRSASRTSAILFSPDGRTYAIGLRIVRPDRGGPRGEFPAAPPCRSHLRTGDSLSGASTDWRGLVNREDHPVRCRGGLYRSTPQEDRSCPGRSTSPDWSSVTRWTWPS